MERQSVNKEENGQKAFYFVGPLNLDRQTKQASTNMGTVLLLDSSEFDALDMLAASEGETLTFEQLYLAAWAAKGGSKSREAAQLGLDNILYQINEAGKGLFMHIDHKPEEGYTFRTSWGRGYKANRGEIPAVKHKEAPPAKLKKKPKTISSGLIMGMLIAAVFAVMVVSPVSNMPDQDFIYIFDDPVPLAATPNFGNQVIFPVVRNMTAFAGSRSLTADLYNPEENSDSMIFEIILLDTSEVLYTSDLLAPGERIENIEISPLEEGEHRAVLSILVYDVDGLTIIDQVSVDFVINAN